ncbi:hypothetical protein OROGR_007553 [Orobanche gracilis]
MNIRAVEKLDNLTFQGGLLHVMPAIQRPLNKEENNVSKVQNSKTNNVERNRGKQLKPVEIPEHGIVCSCALIHGLLMADSVALRQTHKTLLPSMFESPVSTWYSLLHDPVILAFVGGGWSSQPQPRGKCSIYSFGEAEVLENIARKYGVSKSDLLDPEADGLAVRIALGETQVITETKKALTIAGVNVEFMEKLAHGKVDGLKRSIHVLLVKNLPYDVTESELVKMFGKFGSLDKIILPPTKTLALVFRSVNSQI